MTDLSSRSPTVVVIGSGPAGLVTAVGLVRRNVHVVVLESGDRSFDPGRQELSAAEVVGDELRAFQPIANRMRRLGGNSHGWVVKTAGTNDPGQMGIRLGPITPEDLAPRPWVENSGWPLEWSQLAPWLDSASEHFVIGNAVYQGTPGDTAMASLLGDDFVAMDFRFGRRDRFHTDLVAELDASPLADVQTDATVIALRQSTDKRSVTTARVRAEDGSERDVAGDRFVIACGAVENARLLLASDPDGNGVGNEFDHVGRHLMDHPMYSAGHIEIAQENDIRAFSFFDLAASETDVRHGYAAASSGLCAELGAVRLAFSIFPRPSERHLAAVEALKAYTRREAASPSASVRRLQSMIRGADYFPRAAYNSVIRQRSLLPGFGRGGWSRGHDGMAFTRLEVVFQAEQPPLHESRVRLSEQCDRYGSPMAVVEWRRSEQVERSVLAVQRRLAERVEAAGLGSYRPRSGSFDLLGPPTSMAHHMGTTRMSIEPTDGVVDTNGRVHTVDNLYVAGSSVFPTSGYINPTLTIVALAERLADHLASDMS